MSLDDQAQLKAAIWAAPDAREPARVYADWLLERGNSFGEYLQLRLVETPSEAQRQRAAALLKRDRGRWLGPARPFIRSWRNDERGFVAEVTCEAQQLPQVCHLLPELGPRLQVEVTSCATRRQATVKALAALPLGSLGSLGLSSQLDDDDVAALAPALRGVRELRLNHNQVTARGVHALGTTLDGVRALELVTPVFDPAAVDAILAGPAFAQLERLEIRGLRGGFDAQPSPAQVAALGQRPALRSLNAKWLAAAPWAADRIHGFVR